MLKSKNNRNHRKPVSPLLRFLKYQLYVLYWLFFPTERRVMTLGQLMFPVIFLIFIIFMLVIGGGKG